MFMTDPSIQADKGGKKGKYSRREIEEKKDYDKKMFWEEKEPSGIFAESSKNILGEK